MRTNWEKLIGKDVLIKSKNKHNLVASAKKNEYTDLRQVHVYNTSPSGRYIKYLSEQSYEWFHITDVKLVEELE